MVGKLEDAGLVVREHDDVDRRVCRVLLSDRGQGWLAADRKRRRDWLTEQLRELEDDDVRSLAAAVEVIEGLTSP